MISGTWSVACLLLALGTAPGVPADVVPLSHLKFEIPIRIDPARKGEIRSLELFYSTNQGRTWEQAGVATPEQSAFSFTAPTDGVYWFSVVVVDQRGNKEPPDPSKAPVGQKILID